MTSFKGGVNSEAKQDSYNKHSTQGSEEKENDRMFFNVPHKRNTRNQALY